MTLTALLPSLRRTLPDPLTYDRWPEYTVASTTDVVVCGVSLLRLADLCDTPCVHNAAAVIPGTGGRPSPSAMASVVVVTVLSVQADNGVTEVLIDGRIDHCQPVLPEIRLIGRASTAHSTRVLLRAAGEETSGLLLSLPGDLRSGDMLAVPCSGAHVLADLR